MSSQRRVHVRREKNEYTLIALSPSEILVMNYTHGNLPEDGDVKEISDPLKINGIRYTAKIYFSHRPQDRNVPWSVQNAFIHRVDGGGDATDAARRQIYEDARGIVRDHLNQDLLSAARDFTLTQKIIRLQQSIRSRQEELDVLQAELLELRTEAFAREQQREAS